MRPLLQAPRTGQQVTMITESSRCGSESRESLLTSCTGRCNLLVPQFFCSRKLITGWVPGTLNEILCTKSWLNAPVSGEVATVAAIIT